MMSQPIVLQPEARLEEWPPFPETEISSGTRESWGTWVFRDPPIGLSIGVWEAEPNLGRWMNWPMDEFMVVVEGEVVVVEEDRETVVGQGESFFIPKGRRVIWNQSNYARKFMVLFDHPSEPVAPDGRMVRKVDPACDLTMIPPLSPKVLVSHPPTQKSCELFRSASGILTGGLLESTAYDSKVMGTPRHELMHILDGSVTLSNELGDSWTFATGHTIFLPKRSRFGWSSSGVVRKVYCSIEPAHLTT